MPPPTLAPPARTPAASLRRAQPLPDGVDHHRYQVLTPARFAWLYIDGHWRGATIRARAQARPGGPVAIYAEWRDGRSTRCDWWLSDPDAVVLDEPDGAHQGT